MVKTMVRQAVPLQPMEEDGGADIHLQPVEDPTPEQGEVPRDWRKANVTPIFKKGKKEDLGNYRPVSLTSIAGKVMQQLILGIISRHKKDKKVIRSSHHGFIKGKSCLTNLINFYDEVTGLVDERRALDIVCL
ncbi:mitochondrial enolase superfamily member 1 [Grus japonensis]|uniref:Mitochondrial enolase superfamily member 1 n=1 Tax=Grus japonensis TaxID=30415 RepID=A0ABC9Y243_GRUJA